MCALRILYNLPYIPIFLAAGGVKQTNQPSICLLCIDDFRNGFPRVFMVSKSETAETIKLFTTTVEAAIIKQREYLSLVPPPSHESVHVQYGGHRQGR